MSGEAASLTPSGALAALLPALHDAGFAGKWSSLDSSKLDTAPADWNDRSHRKDCNRIVYSSNSCDCPPGPIVLSRIFASFAPNFLSVDEGQATQVTTRQVNRYILVKLARALTEFINDATQKQQAPQSHNRNTVDNDLADAQDDLIHVTADTVSFLHAVGADSATSNPILDSQRTITRLGEIVLCAALHSPARDAFVAAIMTLPSNHQDALAVAIENIQNNQEQYLDARPFPPSEHERFNFNHTQDENYSSDNDSSFTSHRKSDSDSSITQRSILTENPSITNIEYRSFNGRNIANMTAAHQATAAVKQESAELRERVLALEQELREKSAQVAAVTLQATATRQASIAAQGDTTIPNGATCQLPTSSSPDIAEVRAKARLVDQLEASLKRASTRLEQFGDAKRYIAELEKENTDLRDNERRHQNRIAILKAQLDGSNSRVETLVALGETATKDLQSKQDQLEAAFEENKKIAQQLHSANAQLASLLTGAPQACHDEHAHNEDPPGDAQHHKNTVSAPADCPELLPATPTRVTDSDSDPQSKPKDTSLSPRVICFNPNAASAALQSELGVVMSWEDIVECVRGVVDAMREMDEAEAAHCSLAAGSLDTSQGRLSQKRPREMSPTNGYRNTSFNSQHIVDGQYQHFEGRHDGLYEHHDSVSPPSAIAQQIQARQNHEMQPHAEESSLQPDDDGDTVDKFQDNGQHTQQFPRIRTLQDFIEVDMRMEASCRQGDDDFDFVADQANVHEVDIDESANVDSQGKGCGIPNSAPTLPRRRSSAPSLPTVPEEYEGFVEHGMSASSDSGDEGSCASSSAGGDTNHAAHGHDEIARGSQGNSRITETAPAHADRCAEVFPSLSTSANIVDGEAVSPHSRPASPNESPLMSPLLNQRRQGSPEAGQTSANMNGATEPSVGLLIRQLSDSREELGQSQSVAHSKERECADLRQELALLIKEVDGLMAQRDALEQHEKAMLLEKERLIKHLDESLGTRTSELVAARDEIQVIRRELADLRKEKSHITEELVGANKKLTEILRQQEVMSRAHEVEVAKLTAQLESSEILANKLGECVSQPILTRENEIDKRQEYCAELLEAVRREKSIAAAAREECRQAALSQSRQLAEIHAAAKAAADVRVFDVDMRASRSRRSTRFTTFLRRVTRRDSGLRSSGVIPRTREEVNESMSASFRF